MAHLSLGTRRHKARWRVRSVPELGGSKGDEVETKPAEHGRPGRLKGGGYKGVKEEEKKGVRYGEFCRTEWVRRQGF